MGEVIILLYSKGFKKWGQCDAKKICILTLPMKFANASSWFPFFAFIDTRLQSESLEHRTILSHQRH